MQKLPLALLLVLFSLCGLTLAANSALVFTVFTFSNTLSCLGTNYTQKGYQDSLCYPEGTSSFSWRLVSASVVARREYTNVNCNGAAISTQTFTNSQCYGVNSTNSLKATWIRLVDVTESTYSNTTACQGAPEYVTNQATNYCYSLAASSTNFFVINFTTGFFCSYSQPGCPDTGIGSCIYVTNGACNPANSSAMRYTWATPTPITLFQYATAGCTDAATDSHLYFDGSCTTTTVVGAITNSSLRITLQSATQASLVQYSGNEDCIGVPVQNISINNNQCLSTQTGGAILVWDLASTTSTSTTSQSTTAQSTTTASATATSTSTTGTPVKYDIFYYVYSTPNCTGSPTSSAYQNNLCFGTSNNQSQVASILSDTLAQICSFAASDCPADKGECFQLPNDQCYLSNTTGVATYKLVWPRNSTTTATTTLPATSSFPTITSSSTTSAPPSSTSSTPSSSTSALPSTASPFATSAATLCRCASAAALVLCTVFLLA